MSESGKKKRITKENVLAVYCVVVAVLLLVVGVLFSRVQWYRRMNSQVFEDKAVYEQQIELYKSSCEELEREIKALKGEAE